MTRFLIKKIHVQEQREESFKITKQLEVVVELWNNSHSDVVVDTRETFETVAKEPNVEQVTPKRVLGGSSRTIRVPYRCTFITLSIAG